MFRTLDDVDLAGKRVLLRVDLNAPMKDGKVSDATRIERMARPSTRSPARVARSVLLSHLGRPKGRDPKETLAPLANEVAKAIGRPVSFAEDCVGDPAQAAVDRLKSGEVLLLENTRFHTGEEKNDPAFARELAALGDLYINDGFSVAHRAHASTTGLGHLLPILCGTQHAGGA